VVAVTDLNPPLATLAEELEGVPVNGVLGSRLRDAAALALREAAGEITRLQDAVFALGGLLQVLGDEVAAARGERDRYRAAIEAHRAAWNEPAIGLGYSLDANVALWAVLGLSPTEQETP
jgi:hypothetical protein